MLTTIAAPPVPVRFRFGQLAFGSAPWRVVPALPDAELAALGVRVAFPGRDASALTAEERTDLGAALAAGSGDEAADRRAKALLERCPYSTWVPTLDVDVCEESADFQSDPSRARATAHAYALSLDAEAEACGLGRPAWHTTNERGGLHGDLLAPAGVASGQLLRAAGLLAERLAARAGVPTYRLGAAGDVAAAKADRPAVYLDLSVYQRGPIGRGSGWRVVGACKPGGQPKTPVDLAALRPLDAPRAPVPGDAATWRAAIRELERAEAVREEEAARARGEARRRAMRARAKGRDAVPRPLADWIVARVLDGMAAAAKGEEHLALFVGACRLGELQGAGAGVTSAIESLRDLALAAGRAKGEVARAIRDGLERGAQHPLVVRERVPGAAARHISLASLGDADRAAARRLADPAEAARLLEGLVICPGPEPAPTGSAPLDEHPPEDLGAEPVDVVAELDVILGEEEATPTDDGRSRWSRERLRWGAEVRARALLAAGIAQADAERLEGTARAAKLRVARHLRGVHWCGAFLLRFSCAGSGHWKRDVRVFCGRAACRACATSKLGIKLEIAMREWSGGTVWRAPRLPDERVGPAKRRVLGRRAESTGVATWIRVVTAGVEILLLVPSEAPAKVGAHLRGRSGVVEGPTVDGSELARQVADALRADLAALHAKIERLESAEIAALDELADRKRTCAGKRADARLPWPDEAAIREELAKRRADKLALLSPEDELREGFGVCPTCGDPEERCQGVHAATGLTLTSPSSFPPSHSSLALVAAMRRLPP